MELYIKSEWKWKIRFVKKLCDEQKLWKWKR